MQNKKTDGRPGSKDGAKKNIWDSMLAEAARGKELPEKQLLILGGTPERQRELLEVLSPDPINSQYQRDRQRRRKVPVSNLYALGYTYHDVLDADQEDILARLSVYMLAEPSPAFSSLLKPLLNTRTIPNTLIVILLNWSEPQKWPRQIRQWIRLLRSVLITLDEETKIAMEEHMTEWKERRRGTEPVTTSQPNSTTTVPLLGPGEWDEGLGIPLCVVCQNSEKMDNLEKESNWQEEDFDYVMQTMRTILLKHGSSLVYNSAFDSNSTQSLIHSSLGIHSMLKRETIKANVIDRDKILVPPNWDSWGKIRIHREGFEPEKVADLWSIEIQDSPEDLDTSKINGTKSKINGESTDHASTEQSALNPSETVVHTYEKVLFDPSKTPLSYMPSTTRPTINDFVPTVDFQTFLSQQLAALETQKKKDEQNQKEYNTKSLGSQDQKALLDETGRKMAESIGPVQFNMGGIQVDADDMVRRLKEREASRTPLKSPDPHPTASATNPPSTTANLTPSTPAGAAAPPPPQTPDAKYQNEALASFFAGLMKNTKSNVNSPRTPAAGGG